MRKRRGGAAAVALLAGVALAGCGGSPEVPRPRLVLLYATCTLAKDFLSPYDDAVSWTPEIGRFAGRGVVFRRHQTEAGLSGVAFALGQKRGGVVADSRCDPVRNYSLIWSGSLTESCAATGSAWRV